MVARAFSRFGDTPVPLVMVAMPWSKLALQACEALSIQSMPVTMLLVSVGAVVNVAIAYMLGAMVSTWILDN